MIFIKGNSATSHSDEDEEVFAVTLCDFVAQRTHVAQQESPGWIVVRTVVLVITLLLVSSLKWG